MWCGNLGQCEEKERRFSSLKSKTSAKLAFLGNCHEDMGEGLSVYHFGEELVGVGLLSPSESSLVSLSILGFVGVVREPGSAKSGR